MMCAMFSQFYRLDLYRFFVSIIALLIHKALLVLNVSQKLFSSRLSINGTRCLTIQLRSRSGLLRLRCYNFKLFIFSQSQHVLQNIKRVCVLKYTDTVFIYDKRTVSNRKHELNPRVTYGMPMALIIESYVLH